MTTRGRSSDPLPPEWLPDPVPSDEEVAYWHERLERLMDAAEPVLERYRRPTRTVVPWWSALQLRWRPAVAGTGGLAAAAVLVAVLAFGPELERHPPTPADPAATVLSAVVSGGDAVALWSAVGANADPTLALLALEYRTAPEGDGR